MPWISKETPSPFDNQPIRGLFFLDGDQVAYQLKQTSLEGQKYPMIVFPSGVECPIWETSNPQAIGIVHIFGELDLPLSHRRDTAFAEADSIAQQCGYRAKKIGENGIEVWGHDRDEHFQILYNDEQRRIANIIQIQDPMPKEVPRPMELLPHDLREQLPKLYANEKLGLDANALVKLFTPDSNWTWYLSEFDGEDICFGLVSGLELELGYFSLSELEEVRGPLGLPIERDLHYEPKALRELKTLHERGETG